MVRDTNYKPGDGMVPYTEEQIMKVFQRHDKNGDGQLSKDELDAAFDKLGSKWPAIRSWFAQRYADDDRDGFISIDKELSKLVKAFDLYGHQTWATIKTREGMTKREIPVRFELIAKASTN